MEEQQARSYNRLLHRLHNSETSSASRRNRARWNRAPCTIASSSAIFPRLLVPVPAFSWRGRSFRTSVLLACTLHGNLRYYGCVGTHCMRTPVFIPSKLNRPCKCAVLGGCQNCTKPAGYQCNSYGSNRSKKPTKYPVLICNHCFQIPCYLGGFGIKKKFNLIFLIFLIFKKIEPLKKLTKYPILIYNHCFQKSIKYCNQYLGGFGIN